MNAEAEASNHARAPDDKPSEAEAGSFILRSESRAVFLLHLTNQVGWRTLVQLRREFGSAQGALAAPESRLKHVANLGPTRVRAILDARASADELVEKEQETAAKAGARIVTVVDAGYPSALRSIYDPPLALYIKGELKQEDGLAIAIVGTRSCSFYGRSTAERLASGLAHAGFVIVSGMARGIDTAAHSGALEAGGRTIAVLGCGLSHTYPEENRELSERIANSGALLSEFPMSVPPSRQNFPRRNRTISGLSLGAVIVEGDVTSGAMITARYAMEQGREVFAVPGKIDSILSRGPHRLISDGAKLITGVDDIIDELGPLADGLVKREHGERTEESALSASVLRTLSPNERLLYGMLSNDPVPIDEITTESGLAPQEVSAAMLVLEIKRLCRQLPGKTYVRTR